MTNGDIVSFLDRRAPFATAEDWDHVGLLIGSPAQPVHGILVALDATAGALEAAKAVGADLIVTHHPVIFDPLSRLDPEGIPYRAAAAGISVISAHTNLDKADGGVNDTLAHLLGLADVRPAPDGIGRIGVLPQPTDPVSFARTVGGVLSTAVRVCGNRPIRTVAVCGGSGGDQIGCLAPIVDAYVTGEVRHHEWIAAEAIGLAVLEAGHYATEVPVVDTLYQWLREAFPSLPITVYGDAAPYLTVK